MQLTSEFKENEIFERALRSVYPKQVCDIVIEWKEEALSYVFKESDIYGTFILGRVNRETREIEYSNELYDCVDVITSVMNEMEYAIDDNGTDSRESIEEELRVLSKVL